MDALKKVDNSPHIFIQIAKIFYKEQKLDKAIKFARQAVHLDRDNGDSWVYLIKFLQQNQQENALEIEQVLK